MVTTTLVVVPSAHAAKIYNMSGVAQVVEIKTSEGFISVTIENNQLYQTAGAIDVRYNWREVRIDWRDEYVLWPDGGFWLQHRTGHAVRR